MFSSPGKIFRSIHLLPIGVWVGGIAQGSSFLQGLEEERSTRSFFSLHAGHPIRPSWLAFCCISLVPCQRKEKRAYQPSNCVKAHPEGASQLLIRSSQPGWGLISTPKHYSSFWPAGAAEQFCTTRIIWVFFSPGLLQNPLYVRANANWGDANVKGFVPSWLLCARTKSHRQTGPHVTLLFQARLYKILLNEVFGQALVLLHWRHCIESRRLNYRKSTQSWKLIFPWIHESQREHKSLRCYESQQSPPLALGSFLNSISALQNISKIKVKGPQTQLAIPEMKQSSK